MLVAITEALSWVEAVHFQGVLGAWLFCLIALTALYRYVVPCQATSIDRKPFKPLSFLHPSIAAITTIAGITALIAIVAPPNNYDSMTYHLGRIVHWLQNHSVAHYPTHITRQLYSSPWAEFAVLHLQLLTDSDTMANLVQWFAMVGSVTGVTLIVQEFGGSRRAQLLAAVTCATIPMGILQSSSTQNDYVVTFWIICFIYFSQRAYANPRLLTQLAMGGSIGLAILTKGTAYPLAFPLVIWNSWHTAKKGGVSRVIHQLALMAIIILALNAGHYLRNYQTFGNPLSTDDDRLTNETFNMEDMIVNAGRNLVMQFATPVAPINEALVSAVKHFYSRFGMGANGPLSTRDPFTLRPLTQFHEDFAVNPIHVLLIIMSFLLILGRWSLRQNRLLFTFSIALTSSYLLFCFLLKWQPWGSRLLLPLFAAWSPAIGLAITETFSRQVVACLRAFLIIAALPWLFFNTSRPLLTIPEVIMNRLAPGITANHSILTASRDEQYYANKPHFRKVFNEVAKEIKESKCTHVGLQIGGDFWEYALWKEVGKYGIGDFTLEHIHVNNASGNISSHQINSCLTVQAGSDNLPYLAPANVVIR